MKNMQRRKRLDAQTKEPIIKSATEEGAKIADIFGRYEVGSSTIHRRVKEHRASLTGLISESEAENMKAVYEKKIRALEEENEILRKAMNVFSDIER